MKAGRPAGVFSEIHAQLLLDTFNKDEDAQRSDGTNMGQNE